MPSPKRPVVAVDRLTGQVTARFDDHCHDRMDDWYYACRARKYQKI